MTYFLPNDVNMNSAWACQVESDLPGHYGQIRPEILFDISVITHLARG